MLLGGFFFFLKKGGSFTIQLYLLYTGKYSQFHRYHFTIMIKENEDGCYPKEIDHIIVTSSLLFSVDHMVTTILLYNRFYPFLTMSSTLQASLVGLLRWTFSTPHQPQLLQSKYQRSELLLSTLIFFCLGMKRNLRKIEHTMYSMLPILPPTFYKVQKKLNSIHAEMIVAKNIET